MPLLNDDFVHKAASFAMVFWLIGLGVFAAYYGLRDQSGAGDDHSTGFDRKQRLRACLVAAFVLIWIGLGCFSGVGVHRRDHYYDYHLGPWPGAHYFTDTYWVVLGCGCLLLYVWNWVTKVRR